MIPSVRFFLASLMCASVLGGCVLDKQKFEEAKQPQDWYAVQGMDKAEKESFATVEEAATLKAWWTLFNDPVLDKLVSSAMALSPDRAIALAKVTEARGIRRSTASSLFPQVNASASERREDTGTLPVDNYYDAGFDASYELDIFGKNRNATKAADLTVESLQAQFEDVTLTLIAEVARSYTEYRFFERQVSIAEKNLESEQKTLDLIRKQNELGEATQLDVERAENQTNATRATIPDFKNQSAQARLRLSVLTGLLPEYIGQILQTSQPIPEADIKPVLASPAQVLNVRPDVKAARAAFAAQTKTVASETANLFPSITLSGLFGIQDSAFVSSASVWRVVAGAAVNLIDFGRIEGRINAAKAREEQAYHMFRKTILEAVTDVEQSMQGYAHINEQRAALNASLQNAQKALDLSQQLYKEGEISFLDVLDAQRSVNQADLAASQAEYAQTVALISLYKSLGVY